MGQLVLLICSFVHNLIPFLVFFRGLIMAVFLFVFDHPSIFEHPVTHARYNKKKCINHMNVDKIDDSS